MKDSIELKRLDSFESALSMRDEWDALVERVGGDVFNTFDWCSTWWMHFGHRRTLAVYVARREGALVAVWPLFREKIRWGPLFLRVIRVVGCDHGVTTCNLSTESDALNEVAASVMADLESEGRWDLLHIGEIPGYAENSQALSEAFRDLPQVCGVRFDNEAYPHAVFDVPADYESFLAGLSVKERRNVRHDERELGKSNATYVEPENEQQLRIALDDLIALHKNQWAARGRHGHFDDVPGVESFHRDVARKCLNHGRLALVEVKTSAGAISSEYALRFNYRVHWIIGGRRTDVSSRVGFCALMRNAVRDGIALIDGLPGTYDYKRRLGARNLHVKTISVLPQGGRGAMRLAMTRMVVQLVSLIYHRAWFWHFAPWIAAKFPHVSAMLIRPGLWERFARSRFLVAARQNGEEKAGPVVETE